MNWMRHAFVGVTGALCLAGGAYADLSTGLIAHYPLQGNAHDVSGNGHHGVMHGCTVTDDRYGIANGASHFSSNQDWIEVPGLDLVSTPFTISAWVRIASHPTPGLWDFVRKGNHANYRLGIWGEEATFGFSSPPPPNWTINICRGGTVTLNTWHLVTGIYDRAAGMTRLYLDGYLVDSNPNAQDPYIEGMFPFEIGNWSGTRIWTYETFVGDVDDVRIYDRALSDCEILLLAWCPFATEGQSWARIKALYR